MRFPSYKKILSEKRILRRKETVLKGGSSGCLRSLGEMCPFWTIYAKIKVRAIKMRGKEMAMPRIEVKGKKYEVNEEGFLAHPEEWNEEVAAALAKEEEGIDEMTEAHWSVVNYIRTYYVENNLAPMVRKVCQTTGFQLRYIYELFPSGPAKGACKVAGLPKPDGCV
jgi:tRNA 2-thiouridine synthesizing protein E